VTTRPRTVFLGSGAFALPIVRELAESPDADLVGVVTAPPRSSGRGLAEAPSPVGAWAADAAAGLALLTPTRLRDPEALAAVEALRPELLVLADYGRIVPAAWLELPRLGALNVHPSLLPRHRGASPVAAAILAGDERTGTTLMRMDEGVDTGPIVVQRAVPLHGDEEAPELEARLAELGAALLREALPEWVAGDLEARPQPEAGASATRPLKRADGRLRPERSAAELERQVRAYQPWPGSFLETEGGRLAVWRARAIPADEPGAQAPHDREPGTSGPVVSGMLVPVGDGLGLATTGGILELVDVQRAGGRRMSGAELLRGRRAWLGERVVG
jgi:methionyl-tRNA formyltransferase